MYVLDDKLLYVDVDDTLVFWENDGQHLTEFKLNYPLINKLKEYHQKGWTIIIWTSNSDGARHAAHWVRQADIEDIIFSAQVKPHIIIDDDHLEYYSILDPKTLEYRK